MYFPGISTHSYHASQQMKNQIALENRQAHMLFGVVTLFFIGYTLRMVLNVNELHVMLTRSKEEAEHCPVVFPFWIRVSFTILIATNLKSYMLEYNLNHFN